MSADPSPVTLLGHLTDRRGAHEAFAIDMDGVPLPDALASQYAPFAGQSIHLPGVSGEFISTPDAADIDLAGDFTCIVRVALDDWAPPGSAHLVSKFTTNTGYLFSVNTAGQLNVTLGNGASVSAVSTANLSDLAAGSWKSVAVTVDADNGASGWSARFWTSDDTQPDDDSTWTQLGSTVTTATAITISANASPLGMGATGSGTSALMVGRYQKMSLRSGIGALGVPGGTEVAEWNCYSGVPTRYRDATGHVFVANGTAWSQMTA